MQLKTELKLEKFYTQNTLSYDKFVGELKKNVGFEFSLTD